MAQYRVFLTLFCFVIMGAGWYYLFYSRAPANLSQIEPTGANVRRARLRRVGGFTTWLLGGFLYVGFFGVSWEPPTRGFVVVWLCVFLLLMVMVGLALADVMLTRELRRHIERITSEGKSERKDLDG